MQCHHGADSSTDCRRAHPLTPLRVHPDQRLGIRHSLNNIIRLVPPLLTASCAAAAARIRINPANCGSAPRRVKILRIERYYTDVRSR